MKKVILLLILLTAFPTISLADERCGPGKVFSRDTINCIQEFCPPATGRNYSNVCQCYNSDWGADQVVRSDCRDGNGLLTHCAKEGETCENIQADFDPVSGSSTQAVPQNEQTGISENAEVVRPSFGRSMLNFLQSIGLFTTEESRSRGGGNVVTSVFGKVSNFFSNLF